MRLLLLVLIAGISLTTYAQNSSSKTEELAKTENKVKTIHLNKIDFLKKVANYEANPNEWKYLGDKPALIDFYADWCGPCKMMAPIVEALSEELSDVKVCHINIDENIDIAQKYRVMSIPTFIAFKGGEESGRQIGAIPKTALVDLVK